jgi:predicted nucleic acid-binding protein
VILVDTSAWVEFDRATRSPVDLHLTSLIAETDEVAVTEPIIMEVIAGARDDRREQHLRRLLQRFELVRVDAVVDFDAAARIYRRCRRSGVTPRGMIDCLIAAVAARRGVPLLSADVDLARVADVIGIGLVAPGV